MRTLRIAAAALIVCTALVACAGQGAGDGTATPTGAPTVTELPTPDPTEPPAADPTDTTGPLGRPGKRPGGPPQPTSTGEMTLTGQIESGVEPGCLLLDGYLLLGGPREVLTAGAAVTVTGRPEPGLMTTCQQGTPFKVASAKRA
ncbi:hypothetical protein ACGFIK_04255 [Micromonospora sp. NPDC048871]|uniref:hypothetical protein n=1 Tax=unclassified Micromonospora TaxID=2617518 RepID=UPI002E0FAA30|nr:hypothetical protein OIE53_18080 [Micromonospora sp. NBC_01739]